MFDKILRETIVTWRFLFQEFKDFESKFFLVIIGLFLFPISYWVFLVVCGFWIIGPFLSNCQIYENKVVHSTFFSINLFIYLFLAGWVFVAARGLSLVAASGGYSSLRCGLLISMASLCCRARTLGARALVVAVCELSSCGSRAVERRLSSCGAWA